FGRVAGLALNAVGKAKDLAQPAARATDFTLQGSAEGVEPSDPRLREVVGSGVKLTGKGAWSAGQPVNIDNLQLALGDASASFAGTATRDALSGAFAAAVGDLSRFAALAGRELGGQADVKATGTATLAGAFDLKVDGETTDLRLGLPTVDPLLKGGTTVG